MCDFEEISRKRARRFFKIKNLKLPIDIEKIINEYADLEEDFIPYEVDAICINRRDRPLIIIKKNVSESRRRFTLAHELGHIQIPWHTGMLSCHTDDGEKIDSSKYYQMEREANIFAAELLMPRDWLRDLVNLKKNQDLKELIDIICEQAQVSFTAALYNLINILPIGYIIYIENKKENYSHKKITGTLIRPVFLSSEDGVDFEWIRFNSYQNGIIQQELLNVYWYKYKNILNGKVIDSCIEKLSRKYSLSNLLVDIIDTNNFSIAINLRLVVDKLPPGYIFKIIFIPTETYSYLVSDETYVYPKGIGEENIDNWYNGYCQDSGVYKEKNIIIKWWYFKTTFDFQLNNDDKRNSKIILSNIINNCCLEDDRKSIFSTVNGIFGSLNNNRSKMEPEQFYNILRQKFLGKENLEPVIEHTDFNQFLVKKTLELYKK